MDLPPFDTTAMDGWAVRIEDALAVGVRLDIAGALGAGAQPPDALPPRSALKIMTGAPMPAGSDAVVPVEEAVERNGMVELRVAPKTGQHIRRRGEVIEAGTRLLAPGRRLTPAGVAL